VLDDFGLEPALERLVRVVSERSGLVVRLNVDSQLQALPPELETALYRIVQEGLTNVVKHARASAVSIVLAGSEGNVRLLIEDDGVGFDPSSVRTGAFGLIGMRERVSLLRGRLLVESEVGAGATVIIDLPLPARDA
jgi:signal transduction histidine kinase